MLFFFIQSAHTLNSPLAISEPGAMSPVPVGEYFQSRDPGQGDDWHALRKITRPLAEHCRDAASIATYSGERKAGGASQSAS
jgi:hypothetical protein